MADILLWAAVIAVAALVWYLAGRFGSGSAESTPGHAHGEPDPMGGPGIV